MSAQNLENFTSFVMSDATLRERLASAPDLDSATKIASQIAQEKGYDLTVEEVKSKLEEIYRANQSGELSDELLEAVAGGKGASGSVSYGGFSIGGSISW